jgi:hypothetical protein
MTTYRDPVPSQLPDRLPPLAAVTPVPEDEFYRRFPPAAFVDVLERRRRSTRLGSFLAFASGAAAAVLLVALVGPMVPKGPGTEGRAAGTEGGAGNPFGLVGQLRDKGMTGPRSAVAVENPAVSFHKLVGSSSVPLSDGALLKEGDVLRFFYDSGSFDYVFLLSVDAWGRVSSYYPDGSGFSVPVVRGRNLPLPGGVMLDDFVGYERFYAIFSRTPLSRGDVEAAVWTAMLSFLAQGKGVEDLVELPLPLPQATLLVEKR